MRAGPPFLLALALLGPASASGLTPRLVEDINTVPLAQGSIPQGYAEAGGLAFFAADDGHSGMELWRSDGTAAGTFQVADACAGDCGSKPVIVARTERAVFFQAFGRGFGPVDLWISDGSPAGTIRLAGPLLLPDPARSAWIAGEGVLYFAANDLKHGMELWRSDGTPAGTFQVADLRPGTAGSEPAELTALDGSVFFTADDGVRGPSLWASDGSAEGTRLVRDPLPGRASHRGPSLLRAAGGTLFFAAPVTRRRDGLWTSDGTPAGTSPRLDIPASASGSPFLDATVLGGRLLFVMLDPAQGHELWASDGTQRGTLPLTRFSPDAPFSPLGSSNPRLLPERALGHVMVFRADDGAHGVEPWITDGTPAGTRLLRDVCPGACSGTLSMDDSGIARVAAGALLFFSAGNESRRGFELWATDGTADGTRLVRDLCRGRCSSEPLALHAGAGAVFLLGRDTLGITQLWRSDGTMPGTVRLTSFERDDAFAASSLGTPLGNGFLFSAGDLDHGRELWRSDGTPHGTGLFLDLNPEDFGGSYPTELRTAAGKAWFFADDGVHGFELWASDGSEAGTVLAAELIPGAGPDEPPSFPSAVELASQVFFVVHLAEPSFSLWRTDGTPGGTVRLTPPDLQVVALEPLRVAGGRLFFVAADAEHGEELWTSDGTEAGTRPAADLEPGVQSSQPRSLTVFQDRLYFTAEAGDAGRELWASDGTPAGTVLVKDIDPRPGRGSEPQLLTPHAGRLYFPAADEEHGRELWSTDGTTAGTRLAAEVTPGSDGVLMTHLVSTGPHLFFSGGPAGITRQGLWVSDGTPTGTRQLSQKPIHIDTRPIGVPGAFNGHLFFASDGDEVLWRSDGTEEGTGPVLDAEGLEIDEPEAFHVFAGRLFFTTGLTSLLYETDGTPEGTSMLRELASPFELGGESASFELVTAGGRLLFRSWDRETGSELWALEAE